MSVDLKRAREEAERYEEYSPIVAHFLRDLADEVEDWRGHHAQVLTEKCHRDEQHCTCVPSLRREVERLREWQRIAETVPVEDMEDRIGSLENERDEVWEPLLQAARRAASLLHCSTDGVAATIEMEIEAHGYLREGIANAERWETNER